MDLEFVLLEKHSGQFDPDSWEFEIVPDLGPGVLAFAEPHLSIHTIECHCQFAEFQPAIAPSLPDYQGAAHGQARDYTQDKTRRANT